MTSADAFTDVTLSDSVARALEGRALLAHPFYRRWEAGLLTQDDLAEYAVHYRSFEAVLPQVLAGVVEGLHADGELEAEAMVRRNLEDELGRPEPHLALFDRFTGTLVGQAVSSEPGPAAEALVQTYLDLGLDGPVATLAGLAAYETQASAIASTKADGLRRWYGMDQADTEFWDVHAAMDEEHGEWALEALFVLGADPDEVAEAAQRAADAWWAFLDEREAYASVLAAG